MSNWWVYLIETDKGNLYTGISTDVERRFQEHLATALGKSNKGARFFRSQRPLRVVHKEAYPSRSEASKREIAIKRLSATKKLQLCVLTKS